MHRARIAVLAVCIGVGIASLGAAQVRPPVTLTPTDLVEIQQLYARYVYGVDTGADGGRLFADVFTEDGMLRNFDGVTYTGSAALVELARRSGKGPAAATQFIYNVLIESTPDGITGKSYVVITLPGRPGTPAEVVTGGQYHDTLVKAPEGWRIQTRTFVRAINYPSTPAR